MASTTVGQKSSLGALPAPHLKLANSQAGNIVTIRKVQRGNGGYDGDVKLFRYPIVTAMDLSQKQIDNGVYVEMLVYRNGRSQSSHNYQQNSEAGWVVPSSWVGGVNTLPDRWTRSGVHTIAGGGIVAEDRPNHYKVSAQNEQINVYEYLNGRFCEFPCYYYDTSGALVTENVVTPVSRMRSKSPRPGSRFAYSGQYRPLRVKFRYIMWDKDANNYVSGPSTQEVLIAHDKHPFIYDAANSVTHGRSVASINPAFSVSQLRAWQGNNLP